MGYTLNNNDRAILQQVIKDVNALTISKKQGRKFNQYNRKYTYVKLTENVLDGGNPTLFWYGEEVGFDSDGTPVVKTNGKEWDVNSSPLLVEGAEGAVDDVVRVEPSALSDNTLVWLALKAEGGETKVRLKVKADVTVNTTTSFLCDIVDLLNVPIELDVNVHQKKFTSAEFYEDEIIYGDVYGSDYLADAYIR